MPNLSKYKTKDKVITMMQVDTFEWSAIGHVSKVYLDDTELKRCELLNKDMDKFLTVKQHLINGYSPTEIEKLTKIVRSTVYNYKKLLSKTSLEILAKTHVKDMQNTEMYKTVFCFILTTNNLDSQNTFWNITCMVAALLGVFSYLFWKDCQLAKWQEAQAKKRPARSPFLKAFDLAHRKELIIVSNKKQLAAVNRLLRHYKNTGRKVELLEYQLNENESDYFDRKEQLKKQHLIANLEQIKAAKAKYYEELNKLHKSGKLDYLGGDLNNVESKAFVEGFTQALEAENL